MKTRHNKKRNTAFLYEVLVRELTKSVIDKDEVRKETIVSICKEHFKKGSTLKREKDIYDALGSTTGLDSETAERLLQEAKNIHSRLDKKAIYKEQSRLIESVNRNLSKNVYNNFVKNYKSLATIAQIFNDDTPIKNKILLEKKILGNLTESAENQIQDLEPIDDLTFNSFAKSFNEKYGNLSESQKSLISKFIMSEGNDLELKVFLNEELGRLKESVKKSLLIKEVQEDHIMTKKMNEVSELLESFSTKEIKEKEITKILKIQELIAETEKDDC